MIGNIERMFIFLRPFFLLPQHVGLIARTSTKGRQVVMGKEGASITCKMRDDSGPGQETNTSAWKQT